MNVQEFISSGKRCGELAERVPLDVTEWDVEIDELGILDRLGDGKVSIADDLREVGVVAGVSTEDQAQAGILIRVHRRATCADANSHVPFVW